MHARPAGFAAAFLLVLGFLALFPSPTRSADAPRATLAILRRDGIIIPFATFDGRRWSNRWPVEQAVNVPIGLNDVPKGWWSNGTVIVDWKAWLPGGTTRPIKVTEPVVLKVQCLRRVGLRTDYVSLEPAPPPPVQPYPKAGLAVAGGINLEPIEVLAPTGPEAGTVVEGAKSDVSEAENKGVRAWSRFWSHPLDEKGRAKTPLTLEVLTRTPGVEAGSQVFYFEGVKKYPGFPQDYLPRLGPGNAVAPGGKPASGMCDYLTYAGGWLLTSAKQPKPKAIVGAEISNCNRQGLAYSLPLGAIRADGHLFWVVQTSGWDFERYDVIEMKPNEVKTVLSVGGGACQ